MLYWDAALARATTTSIVLVPLLDDQWSQRYLSLLLLLLQTLVSFSPSLTLSLTHSLSLSLSPSLLLFFSHSLLLSLDTHGA